MIHQDHTARTTCLPCIGNILQDQSASFGVAPAVVGHLPLPSQAFELWYECSKGLPDCGSRCAQQRYFFTSLVSGVSYTAFALGFLAAVFFFFSEERAAVCVYIWE